MFGIPAFGTGRAATTPTKTAMMYKLRLNPSKPQVRNFDTSDIDDPEIGTILNVHHDWEGNEHRYELMKRVQLWRFVSHQPDYDIGERFMRRIEYQPIGITA